MLALIEQLREFETALIAEAMGALGCPDPQEYYTNSDIGLVTSNQGLVAGAAITLEADTSTPGNVPYGEDYWECLARVERSELPAVLVIKALGARLKHECLCGDGMCKILSAAGCAAIVADGPVRDVEGINRTDITVFATGTVSNHASMIYRLSKGPVNIGGVLIANGELLTGDRDGLIKVPKTYQPAIVEACMLSRDFETRVHTHWRRSDKTLVEKREYVTELAKKRAAACRRLPKGD